MYEFKETIKSNLVQKKAVADIKSNYIEKEEPYTRKYVKPNQPNVFSGMTEPIQRVVIDRKDKKKTGFIPIKIDTAIYPPGCEAKNWEHYKEMIVVAAQNIKGGNVESGKLFFQPAQDLDGNLESVQDGQLYVNNEGNYLAGPVRIPYAKDVIDGIEGEGEADWAVKAYEKNNGCVGDALEVVTKFGDKGDKTIINQTDVQNAYNNATANGKKLEPYNMADTDIWYRSKGLQLIWSYDPKQREQEGEKGIKLADLMKSKEFSFDAAGKYAIALISTDLKSGHNIALIGKDVYDMQTDVRTGKGKPKPSTVKSKDAKWGEVDEPMAIEVEISRGKKRPEDYNGHYVEYVYKLG
ncbi:hypothetical protein [Anaeromicropila populeti]|uniref:Uncharacterized protein n=1 Tax=Anaeromicropila populeti TaxID=37658 RepID=A0A1I6I593_9FIRM|nr:hypothetical protein [Anaeromicropila populeti]SFR61917.1 hypothetical protein SAMN05661086_00426 [Anaeromicropila populeti]